MSKNYSLEGDLIPIITGDVALPNFVEEPLPQVAVSITACGHSMLPKWGYANRAGRKEWAQFFLTPAAMGSAQSGSFDGGGYVLIYHGGPKGATAGRFAICQHEKAYDPGANPSRGWHPGHCTKCGLDMTIDSGD